MMKWSGSAVIFSKFGVQFYFTIAFDFLHIFIAVLRVLFERRKASYFMQLNTRTIFIDNRL